MCVCVIYIYSIYTYNYTLLVNQLFLWAIFKSKLLVYQRVTISHSTGGKLSQLIGFPWSYRQP